MRITTLFFSSLGFALPSAAMAQAVPQEYVQRMEKHQACVRECDTTQMSERSSGLAERQARQRHFVCRMDCNDVLTGRRPSSRTGAEKTALQ